MSAVTSETTERSETSEREFQALVEPYRRVLEIHCYRMLGSRHDAEDLVQETLLRAWRSFGGFEGRAAVSTWLYRIATNACLDEIARRPRRAEPVVGPYPDALVAGAGAGAAAPIADPEARYALREGLELALLTAIQRLPGRQRAVLILRDVLGWSGPEVADLLETSVPAVNGALQRARATIDTAVPAASARTVHRDADRALLAQYVDAWERHDIITLVALLRDDAVLSMPPRPSITGAAAIGAFFASGCGGAGRLRARPGAANGRPALLLFEPDGMPHRLLVLEVANDRQSIAIIRAYAEPRLADFAV
ncbi:RNA polymerase subunit sigma-70 [Baekduia sp. Peel2402]|uniref:RNA polymerase subunit sigma-70 n=1 Tax=Baekduia sp. Peel2402 TaxID=3458296 RepID=UPI00403E48CE